MALVPRFNTSNQNPLGMIVSSMLTEAQYQALNGPGWVLADGRSVVGSAYAVLTGNTVAPDLRGQVLRGKNNSRADGQQDPAGEIALGTQQPDAIIQHTHDENTGQTTQNHPFASSGASLFAKAVGPGATVNNANSNGNVLGATPVAAETRVKSVIVNHFIKINN